MPSKRLQHRWRLDYTNTSGAVYSTQPRPPPAREALDFYHHPPGFPRSLSATDTKPFFPVIPRQPETQQSVQATYKSAWNVAFSPLRTLVTSAFALFMIPSSVQLFSMASVVAVLFVHLRALAGIFDAFRSLRSLRFYLIPHIILYLALCAVGVFLALRKADNIGLLPTTESDWIGLLPYRLVTEPHLRL